MSVDPLSLEATAAELAQSVREGSLSAEALVARCLAAIAERQQLGAFLTVDADGALDAARQLDARRDAGETLGALAGVPVAVKDTLCTRGLATTAASRILTRDGTVATGWRPPYDATVVAKLRAADAIIIGKTNLDELAMGSSNENSAFGAAANPWDERRTPGGSSGGSAVAVAARLTPLALGSDTGGSIRQPAALCGVVGIKPSYGRVSRYGLIAFASSLDQVGPIARDVRSAAGLLTVLSGHDPADSTSVAAGVPDFEAACTRDLTGVRVGVPTEYFGAGLDPQVEATVRRGIDALERAGAQVREVSLPHTRYGVATYYVLCTAEASSNLARLDGVRQGLRVEPKQGGVDALYQETRAAGFGREVERRILLGTFVLSAGYYDAYYKKAQQVRSLVARDFERAFTEVDLLATPTTPTVAFALGELATPLQMYLQDVFTLPASLAGVAAMSVPVGVVQPPDGERALPVGLQLIAPAFEEARLLTAAAHLEAAFPPRAPGP